MIYLALFRGSRFLRGLVLIDCVGIGELVSAAILAPI